MTTLPPLYVSATRLFKRDEQKSADVPLKDQIAKAETLSYQLPDAATEIRRLDNIQRNLEKDLQRLRPTRKPEFAILKDWLESNQDLSVADVNLGDSELTLEILAQQDVSGLGRYAMRGDMRSWMDRVSQLDSLTGMVAGDWSAEDVKSIDQEMRAQVKQAVSKDAVRRRKEHIDLIQQMCGQLQKLSDGRDFRIDPEFITDDTEQLRRLADHVAEWHSHIVRYGHPHKLAEAEIQRRIAVHQEAENRKRIDARDAAVAAGLLLSEVQLDQVLIAYYEEKQPTAFLSKKQKLKIEADIARTRACQEAAEASSKARCERLTSQLRGQETEIASLRDELAQALTSAGTLRGAAETAEAETSNIHVAAGVLARRRIHDAEQRVAELGVQFQAARVQCDRVSATMDGLLKENIALKAVVSDLDAKWNHMLQAKQAHEAEQARIHGGRVSDLQRLVSTLTEVFGSTVHALSELVARAHQLLAVIPRNLVGQTCDLLVPVKQWANDMQRLPGTSESVKAVSSQLEATIDQTVEAAGVAPICTADAAQRSYLDTQREFQDGLVRRLDGASAEIQAKFREQRYFKRVIEHFVAIVSSLIDGSHDALMASFTDFGDGSKRHVPFPAPSAVEPDQAYGVGWAEQVKALDRLLVQLRTELSDSVDRTGAANVLLGAVEAVADVASVTPPRTPKEFHRDSPPGEVVQTNCTPARTGLSALNPLVFAVKRDARMLQHDARVGKQLGVSMLQDIAQTLNASRDPRKQDARVSLGASSMRESILAAHRIVQARTQEPDQPTLSAPRPPQDQTVQRTRL